MNSASSPLPGVPSLYHLDRTFRRAVNTAAFGLLFAAGIRWVAAPQPNAVVKVEHPPVEGWVMQWGSVVGLVVAMVALVVLVRRYFWITKVLTRGTTVQGSVDDVAIYSREADTSSTTPIFRRPRIYTYYALIRYRWQGTDRKVRLHLPHSPSTHRLFKGGGTELMVLDSSPGKPLLRTVYLEPVGIHRR